MFRSQDSLFTLDARGSSSIGSYLTEFDTKTSKWQVSALQGNETWDFKGMSGASHANDPSTGLSFLAGGIPLDSTAVPDYRAIQSSTKGLYAFDFSDPSTPKWSNSTNRTTSQYGAAVPTTSQGSMVYLPVGKRGVLLVIGGNNVRHSVSGCLDKRLFISIRLRVRLRRTKLHPSSPCTNYQSSTLIQVHGKDSSTVHGSTINEY